MEKFANLHKLWEFVPPLAKPVLYSSKIVEFD